MIYRTIAFSALLSLLSFDASAAMGLAQYRAFALEGNGPPGTCYAGPISFQELARRIDDAHNRGLITERAAYWGKAYSFYPLIDPNSGRINAICRGI
ncbi:MULTISPECIES: hypothetical protein [Pseudoalteromonas]|uniref:Uncharacterized protein n=1 Tax=Pseudoalteromonas obscura TaxID=3048491 RepID=A0ABT7EGF9_9GAMM|nr:MULTISPECIES: hypothetical protein [Pseudoalteromonas]MBQ4835622.1 hypothetical protein [Pseudoalteromonas luteoviolacea]MDK2594127.1 hypothetical protein [Pseudoalteromonas sp. P94(2023)]